MTDNEHAIVAAIFHGEVTTPEQCGDTAGAVRNIIDERDAALARAEEAEARLAEMRGWLEQRPNLYFVPPDHELWDWLTAGHALADEADVPGGEL